MPFSTCGVWKPAGSVALVQFVRAFARWPAIAGLGLMLLPCSPSAGQVVAPGAPQAITQLVHDVWRIEDGLPQNSVRAIFQSTDGYLWLGTEEGLVRYNGQTFSVFDKRSVEALKESHSIRVLLEDDEGVLWIGTMGGGLVRFKDRLFSNVGVEQGLSGKVVNAITIGADGEIYVGTADAGLFVSRGSDFEHVSLHSERPAEFIRALTRDRYGAVWVGTRDGLYRINHGRITSFDDSDGLLNNFVMALEGDEDGALWIGTEAGLARYKDGVFTDFRHRGERFAHPVQAILHDDNDNIWIGLDGDGIARVSGSSIDFFDSGDGLSHDRILAIYQDQEGSVWIGTEGGGLNRLRSGKFTTYSVDEGLSHDMALAVYGDSRNAIWIGTEGGGLNRLLDGEITYFGVKDGLSSDLVTSIYGDEEGRIWVGTFRSGLNLLEGGKFQTFTVRDGLPGNGVSALFRGPSGRIWVGTDAGLGVYDGTRFTSLTQEDGLTSDIVMAIHERLNGDVWIGTYDAGVNIISGDGPIAEITTEHGLESNTVLTVYEDDEGTLWIGTYGGGLSRVRGGIVETITTEDGLFNDNVYQILEDDRGNLWMSCNKGIFYVPKDMLNRLADGVVASVRSTSFNKSDGLKSYELNGGFQPAGWKSSDGRLWFPSVRGVVSIDPSSLQPNGVPPPVVLEQVRVDGDVVDLTNEIVLGPGRHKVEFDYVGLSFVDADDVHYRYRLSGYETAWNEAGNRRTATYTNLDPGEYEFHVKAANSDLVWSEQEAVVSLRLQPAYYQTKLFWIVSGFGIFMLAFVGYGVRVRHLKVKQKELEIEVNRRTHDLREAKDQLEHQASSLTELYRFKTKFFNNISHELRTPLTLLLGPLENSLTGAYGNMNGLLRGQLEIMLRNGRRLLRLINQLLDLAKLESGKMELRARPGDLAAFTEGIVLSFTGFSVEREIDLTYDSDDELPEVYFDPEKIEKVLFNLLSNAMKFTPKGGRIDVSVTLRKTPGTGVGEFVEISVADTGPGIPQNELDKIFDRYHQVDGMVSQLQEGTGIGLSLARELVELHSGSIRVQSVHGSGATFAVSIPVGADHLEPYQIAGRNERSSDDLLPQTSMVEMIAAESEGRGATGADNVDPRVNADASIVLVVDDNRDVRTYVRGCLQPEFRVVEAAEGGEALEVLSQILPDLILSDVMMPGMDGYELAQRLKNDPVFSHIPLVLLTAKASESSKIQGLEMGIDDYMSKPFNARELRARLRNLVRIREQEKELRELNDNLERRVQDHLGRILEDRRRYEQELIAARDRAEASAKLKSTILDNVSHELRTPLSTILGYAQLLSKEIDDERRDFAVYIERSGSRLLDTVSAILDLSQLESNSVLLEPTAFKVSNVIKEIATRFEGESQQQGLRFIVHPPEVDIDMRLDRKKLVRVLNHIVSNAVKFTDEGEISLTVKEEGDNVSFEVRDTGVGIGKAFLPDLFTAFKQESDGFDRSHDGSGLGLAISRGLVELMYGRIDVDSRVGDGSTFTVVLPKVLASDPRPVRADRSPVAGSTIPGDARSQREEGESA